MLGMLPLTVAPLGAMELTAPGDATGVEINITNNSWSQVKVYAEDARGALHFLGSVAREEFRLYELPAEVADQGEFRIKVYPQQFDVRSPNSTSGIKTQLLRPRDSEVVSLLLERNLAASVVMFDRG